jgi:signal transduction histidine kinase
MHQNKLFNQTRLRLAASYGGVMAIILGLSGIGFYRIIAHANWQATQHDLEYTTGKLHTALEPVLKQPDQVEARIEKLLPGCCRVGNTCPVNDPPKQRNLLAPVQSSSYYLRLTDRSGQVLVKLGEQPEGKLTHVSLQPWQTIATPDGNRFLQLTRVLNTTTGRPWGYVQVGRSLQGLDDHLATIRLVLLLGLPLTLVAITGASWWLSGLAMQPIYHSYRQIQQFTADAAHELRTPLAAIRATLEATLQELDLSPTETRNTLQVIERQSNRLAQLVQDLLLLSRMDLQATSGKYEPCCLNDVIADLTEELTGLALKANVLLTTEIQVDHLLYVLADAAQLYRLIGNLMTNAIQYTPAGGKVWVMVSQDDHFAVIQIQDTGIGIAASEQRRIFDRFYRVNSDRSRQSGGSGLGLAIAQAIARSHHGEIKVQSEPGKGSLFTLRLPLTNSQPVDD